MSALPSNNPFELLRRLFYGKNGPGKEALEESVNAYENGSGVPFASYGGGATKSGSDNRAALLAALTGNNNVVIPAGDYIIDNSSSTNAGAIYVYQFHGKITCLPGARFIFTTNTKRGFWFYNCHHMRAEGMRVAMQTPTTTRTSPNEAINVDHSDFVTFRDTVIEDSTAAGLLFYACDQPAAFNTHIWKCQADGLHFANCRNFTAIGGIIENSGDDALVTVNYFDQALDWNGGIMNGFRIKTTARYGARINGSSGITMSDIVVDGTVKSGLTVYYDQTALDGFVTRRPTNNVIDNCMFLNCGTNTSGEGSGIYINGVGRCAVSNCLVYNASSFGVHVDKTQDNPTPPGGGGTLTGGTLCDDVTLTGITVDTVTYNTGTGSTCFRFASCTKLNVSNISGKNCTGYGLYATGIGQYKQSGVMLHNVNTSLRAPVAGGAWRIEDVAFILGSGIMLKDDQGTATGYNLSEYSATTSTVGMLTDIVTNFTSGTLGTVTASNTFRYGFMINGTEAQFVSSLRMAAGNGMGWLGQSQFKSAADGRINMLNTAQNGFTRLTWGTEAVANGALKNVGANAVLQARDGTDAGFGTLQAKLRTDTNLTASAATGTDCYVTITDAAGTSIKLMAKS